MVFSVFPSSRPWSAWTFRCLRKSTRSWTTNEKRRPCWSCRWRQCKRRDRSCPFRSWRPLVGGRGVSIQQRQCHAVTLLDDFNLDVINCPLHTTSLLDAFSSAVCSANVMKIRLRWLSSIRSNLASGSCYLYASHSVMTTTALVFSPSSSACLTWATFLNIVQAHQVLDEELGEKTVVKVVEAVKTPRSHLSDSRLALLGR